MTYSFEWVPGPELESEQGVDNLTYASKLFVYFQSMTLYSIMCPVTLLPQASSLVLCPPPSLICTNLSLTQHDPSFYFS